MAAYVIAQVDIHDPETFKEYAAGVPATIKQYGGKYCVRGGAVTPKEGSWAPNRVIVLEFPDIAAAHRWYESPEYQKIIGIRFKAAKAQLIFVEGV